MTSSDADSDARPSATPQGRHRQRSRTRAHIVDAAAGLLRAGKTPSVNEIADAAEVSRRTVYLHFPTLDQLLLDARLGMLSESAVNTAIETAGAGGDAETRVAAMISAMCADAQSTLPLGRSLIRLTVEGEASATPRRGYRRVAWIEKAVEPLRARLSAPEFERLVSALAIAIGWEALIVLQDVRGLPADEQFETMQWAARAIIRTALAEAEQA